MPSLFDSHDEFNEWFSKDIENAAENKGSKLNEHQLRRLHMILKPFMLRRVKRHVQNELSEKVAQVLLLSYFIYIYWLLFFQIEIDISVDMSPRQRSLYKALLANVSVADLLEKAANIGDADSARSLMNLVMQFRKVSYSFLSGFDKKQLTPETQGLQSPGAFWTCRRCLSFFILQFWEAGPINERRRFRHSSLFNS